MGKGPRIVKKYGNRRLYDTTASRYVTLDDLTQTVREGADLQVVDATSGEDLTRETLTQLLMEGRGAAGFLSVPLLLQLIRMDNDALAEFFGRYVALSLEWYERSRSLVRAVAPLNPLAQLPFGAADAMARWASNTWGWSGPPGAPPLGAPPLGPPATPPPPPLTPPAPEPSNDREALASLRAELARLEARLTDREEKQDLAARKPRKPARK